MIGSVTEKMAPNSNFMGNGTNETDVDIDARDAFRVQIACSLTVLAGIFQVCVRATENFYFVSWDWPAVPPFSSILRSC